VYNGKDAIQLIKNNRYSIVFMDYMMPCMDGIETVRNIREIDTEYTKNVPIIALTACVLPGMKKMFLENGFQGFLGKPISPNKLKKVIFELTNCHEANMQIEPKSILRAKERDLQKWMSGTAELNISNGIGQFSGDTSLYISILHSFILNADQWLKDIWDIDDLPVYLNTLFQIKGGCDGIHAYHTAELAGQLIDAACHKDADFLYNSNTKLNEALFALKNKISQILDSLKRVTAYEPEPGLLMELLISCKEKNQELTERLLDKLDRFEYETPKNLMDRLYSLYEKHDYQKMAELLSIYDE